ncbi:plasmodesmata-located protein 6-like [Dioscorea cayenensis subsp. rotundata]|uniref:Plasmodesmata-located protein 6-like n=1 Tax=Dioscorea cayennensis subsp. rotundata TaxID=55577 RepID=A0AB40BLU4_DIOCR|nr:plasmodesmata-located protein 6-like [Dioscorea cayenensis subsp. rotundata]
MTTTSSSSSSSSHHHYNLLLFFFFIISTTTTTTTTSPTTFIYAGCSQSKYSPNSPYEQNLNSLLSTLSLSSTLTLFSNSSSTTFSSSSPAFALFQCLPSLPLPSCSSCIHTSLSKLSSLCSSATSATILLHSCLLRYSNSSFFGHSDTTLLLKTCGSSLPSPPFSFDITTMLDTTLSQLQTSSSSSSYNVAGAGYFQAESQCDGDLSPKSCAECVNLAVRQLRNACGGAVAGDVYLGRCFARFWSINDFYSHKPSSSSSSSSSSSGNEGEKTFAILIGLMAGIALLIVFLTFIRRAATDGK